MEVIAIIFPPIAALACGGFVRFLICIPLTIFFWVPGWLYARSLVRKSKLREKVELAAIMKAANRLDS